MGWTDKVTQMVAGKGSTDKLEMARLEKQYEGVEEALKLVKEVTFESPPAVPANTRPEFARTVSLSCGPAREGTVRPQRPTVQRSQSELAAQMRPSYTSPTGPPDLTAIDLSEEQIQRTYSHSKVWDAKKGPIPPLMQMKGFGRYRISVHADEEWQYQNLRNNLQHLGPLVSALGDFEIAEVSPELMDRLRRESSSTNASSSSSMYYPDLQQGQNSTSIISRGFFPSPSSSARSSSKSGRNHHRKNSSLSTTSLSAETEMTSIRRPSHKSGLRLEIESLRLTAMAPLHEVEPSRKRISKPLLFDDKEGEDAILSDDGDDMFIDDDGMSMNDEPAGLQGHGALAEIIEGQKSETVAQKTTTDRGNVQQANLERLHNLKLGLERSKTVVKKPGLKPAARRAISTSRGRSRRVISNENNPGTQQAYPPQSEVLATKGSDVKLTDPSSDESADVLYIAQENIRPMHLTKRENSDGTSTSKERRDDDSMSFESNSTMRTLTGAKVASRRQVSTAVIQRNRSGTVIRTIPPNVPQSNNDVHIR